MRGTLGLQDESGPVPLEEADTGLQTQIMSGSERGTGRWKVLSVGFRWSLPTVCRINAGTWSAGSSGGQGHWAGIMDSEARGSLA